MRNLILLAALSASLSFGAIGRVNTARASDISGNPVTTLTTGNFVATAGNTQIVFFSWFNTSPLPTTAAVVDHAGNSYALVDPTNGCAIQTTAAKICAYVSNITISDANNNISVSPVGTGLYTVITSIQYSGLDLLSPVDFALPASDPFSNTLNSGGFNTAQPDEVLIFGARDGGGVGLSYTAGPLYTIRVTDADGVTATQDLIVSVPQSSATTSMSCTTAGGWLGVLVALKAAAAPGTASPRRRVISQS